MQNTDFDGVLGCVSRRDGEHKPEGEQSRQDIS
jgi:hypothetical protein